jgi:hypothetical protein
MSWSQTSAMDQKTQFISDYLRERLSITELCALYSIRRKPGYTWIDRSLHDGPRGLEERSRKPGCCPRPMLSGPPTSRATSELATASTATPSRWPMALADFYWGAKHAHPLPSSRPYLS